MGQSTATPVCRGMPWCRASAATDPHGRPHTWTGRKIIPEQDAVSVYRVLYRSLICTRGRGARDPTSSSPKSKWVVLTHFPWALAWRLGPVRGRSNGDVWSYISIPFAKPPLESLRFRPPQPFDAPWEQVLDCGGDFGPYCTQDSYITGVPDDGSREMCAVELTAAATAHKSVAGPLVWLLSLWSCYS
jgi:hypothetical protein